MAKAEYDIYQVESYLNNCGIQFEWHKTSSNVNRRMTCPICGQRNFYYNIEKGRGQCYGGKQYACAATFNNCSIGAHLLGIETKEFHYLMMRYISGEFVSPHEGTVRKVEPPKPIQKITKRPQHEISSSDKLNEYFGAILGYYPLTERDRNDLRKRGFIDSEIDSLGYKSWTNKNLIELCKYLTQTRNIDYKGKPGLCLSFKNQVMFANQHFAGILLPVRNEKAEIVALHCRLHNEDLDDGDNKCRYITSSNWNYGTKAETYCHFACDFYPDFDMEMIPYFKDGIVLVTEGVIKADIIHLMTGYAVVALPGVNNRKDFLSKFDFLKELGVETIVNMFDSDEKTNKQVAQHSENFRKEILEAGFRYKRATWNDKCVESDKVLKGFDDYLMYKHRNIIP